MKKQKPCRLFAIALTLVLFLSLANQLDTQAAVKTQGTQVKTGTAANANNAQLATETAEAGKTGGNVETAQAGMTGEIVDAAGVGMTDELGNATTIGTTIDPMTADGTEVESPDETELINQILATDPSMASAPVTVKNPVPATPYTKVFHFTDDQLFSGIYKSYSYYFNVEDYWETSYLYAQIEFSVSPLIENVPASLTFSVNNTPVSSMKVDYSNGKTQVVYVDIPLELLKEGFNSFSMTGFVRLYDEEGCLDDFSGANWVNISKNSLIQAGYDTIDTKDAICYYPYPFLSSMDETGKDCAIFVPDNATEEELKAALLLRADLGNGSTEEDNFSLLSMSEYSKDRHANKIVVALNKNLPADAAKIVKDKIANVDITQKAFLVEQSDNKGTVLVLTSENGQSLYEGAAMLIDENRVTQEFNSTAVVNNGSADTVIQNSTLSDLTVSDISLESITGNGLSFVGPFRQEQDIFLPLDGGFVLAAGGKITLNFRYSDNLDFNRSLITVYWGDTPISSQKLTKEKAGGDTLSFVMPADVVGTYASSIRVAFDLEIEDLYCTKRADQMPWAYVTEDSVLFLPTGQASKYSFELRPYPFQSLGLFDETYVVVPDEMTAAEENTLGQIISLFSSDMSPYGSLTVKKASNYVAEDTDANVIMLGTFADNKAIADINDKLSFSYNAKGTRFISNKQLLLSDTYAADLATMQIIRNPNYSKRAILVVAGTTDETIERLGNYLSTLTNRWALQGDTVLLDSRNETKTFTFLEESIGNDNISLKETIEHNKDAIVYTVVSTLTMLLLVFAIILIVIRAKKRNKEDD